MVGADVSVRRLWASGVHEPEEMADRLNARGYLYTLRELKLPAAPAAILVKQRRTQLSMLHKRQHSKPWLLTPLVSVLSTAFLLGISVTLSALQMRSRN